MLLTEKGRLSDKFAKNRDLGYKDVIKVSLTYLGCKTIVTSSPLDLLMASIICVDQVYTLRHGFSPVEPASNTMRNLLLSELNLLCHRWASGYTLTGRSVLGYYYGLLFFCPSSVHGSNFGENKKASQQGVSHRLISSFISLC